MKNLVSAIISIVLVFALIGCVEGCVEKETESASLTGKAVTEKMELEIESIPAEFEVEYLDEKEEMVKERRDKSSLGLPADFINRTFLTNTVGYKDKLDYLVGMVVKKTTKNNKAIYTPVLDFKYDTVQVGVRVPADGILVEKKYDRKIGGSINYLIASAEVNYQTAYQVLISDVSEVTIKDQHINKHALYNTYNGIDSITSYYLIRGAVTTSILHKKFSKMDANSEFNAAAIKVGAKYYSEDSDLKRDWKIGMQLTPVNEFLMGYSPPAN
ncbi:MAG: hypothetical protein RH916_05030 [Vicingaceae bacterium]